MSHKSDKSQRWVVEGWDRQSHSGSRGEGAGPCYPHLLGMLASFWQHVLMFCEVHALSWLKSACKSDGEGWASGGDIRVVCLL